MYFNFNNFNFYLHSLYFYHQVFQKNSVKLQNFLALSYFLGFKLVKTVCICGQRLSKEVYLTVYELFIKLFYANYAEISRDMRVYKCVNICKNVNNVNVPQNRIKPITLLFEVDFTTNFDKLLLCVQYLFEEHYPVRPALVC